MGRMRTPWYSGLHSCHDPEAFFHPADNTNERYEELMEHPDWSFYGPQFPSKESILEARDRMFAKHPHTTFVALHMANWPENLDYVSHLLDTLPNVMVEFGAREAELGRQPRRAREFFIKYQDRIMFGTDNGVEEAMYRNHFRWLETGDEYFDYWGCPGARAMGNLWPGTSGRRARKDLPQKCGAHVSTISRGLSGAREIARLQD